MTKTESHDNRNLQHWLIVVVTVLASLTAVGLSVYVLTEIAAINSRLDEQTTKLADLSEFVLTQTSEQTPTSENLRDGDRHLSQDSKERGTCKLGDGCTNPDGTKSAIPAAHLRARTPVETEGASDDDELELEWVEELRSGGMQMSEQKLIVPRSGLYLVYSQMEFDSEISGKAAGHVLKVNDVIIVDENKNNKEAVTYQRQQLQLMAGDNISVTPRKMKRRVMRHLHYNATFFGAFLANDDNLE
ncbi:uncharacterized protein LOC134196942 [Corticium candelabrum]|uniref:uncharacterized protein LOC134196942 n=1 Tax=Corticium candelabrum TaxID=121492 RepID=UPI002E263EB8|nr:uncharacterized protein LOC134196942 [Corticium candelabrum]